MRSPFNQILRRGLLAGLLAGAAAALISLLLVETPIHGALQVEEARSHLSGEHSHEEMFGRTTQIVGGMIAALVVGAAIGTIFAVVFARTRHLLPARTDFGRSLQLAASGFLAIALLPALKYPANPPGVGEAETVHTRTLAYFSLIVAGIAVLCAVHYLHRRLRARGWTPSSAGTAATAAGVAAVGIVLWAWPANPDAIPPDVPAALLWQFRLSSLAELTGMWAVLGASFGLLSERQASSPTPAASPTPA